MEDIWKAVKPYRKNIKGSENNIGYGFRKIKRTKCDRVEKRKAYRDIRKYGFDTSETWSLDCTIMEWLSDNVGDFFTLCGSADNWGIIDLEGNEWPVNGNYNSEESHTLLKKCHEIEQLRCFSYQKHLEKLLNNLELELWDPFRDFVIPRLRYLAKHMHGWPAGYYFTNFKDWQKCVNKMADDFEAGEKCPKDFIKYFWNLWD